ncbi:transcriptional regulator [Altererythrobacter fulvus]|uniref:transcriptional regulator n=1 Tax=Caenibius fulvus TaxID=2126012 RepID=UPI003015A23F
MSARFTPFEALEALVEKAGSQSALARALSVSQTAVWKWLQSSKRLPAEYVLTAEALYGVSRHDLRPDIYPRGYPPAPDARWTGTDRRAGASA